MVNWQLPLKQINLGIRYFVSLQRETQWSSWKVQDSWSLDHQCCELKPLDSQGVYVSEQEPDLNCFVDLTHIEELSGVRNITSLRADREYTWSVANRPRWSEMAVMISWERNNSIQQSFVSSGKRRYTNVYFYYHKGS